MIRAFGTYRPQIHPDAFVADTARVLGDVELDADVSIWFGAVLRGDMGKIRIGARSNIQDNATVHMTHEVSDALVGCDVIVGHNAIIHGAIVEDEALIGMGAIIMDNARISRGAWVAAGSVVPPKTVVPEQALFINGAIKRQVRPEERAWLLDAVKRYVELGRQHRLQQAP